LVVHPDVRLDVHGMVLLNAHMDRDEGDGDVEEATGGHDSA
jgi:hypothetical protein